MPEKFRVDCSLGDSTAVYGDILPVLPPAVLVDNLREAFLTHTTLPGNQHRQIGRSYLNGNINGTHQRLIITDNTKT